MRRWRIGTAAILFMVSLCGVGRAEDVAAFYAGRTVTVVVGSSPGGGYDLNARLVAAHIGRHIPGQPPVVVQNMPGAGGIKLANYMAGVAPRNGAVIAILQRNLLIEPLFSKQSYDGTKFTWLGSLARDVSTCISWHTAPVGRWDDLMVRTYTVAGQSPGADADVFSLVLKNLFGAKVRLISGFPGTNEMMLAMERGEIDGFCGLSYSTLRSRHVDWLRDRQVNVLVQAGAAPEPALADVPFLLDRARSANDRQVVKLIVGTQAAARPFLAPPAIPPERTVALRAAFEATMRDAAFLADAAKLETDVAPMTGAEIDALLADLYATPKPIIELAARAKSEL